jgi:NADP oxidoreductase coenzyme F420-dependent
MLSLCYFSVPLLPNTQNREARVGSFAEATAFENVVVLAVKGSVAADALHLATAPNLAGKPVIDATNPIADLPPENGVLRFFTTLAESLMERTSARVSRGAFGQGIQFSRQFLYGEPEF